MEIVFATGNKGKLKEITDILAPISVVSIGALGIDANVVEDGETFSENALKKARAIAGHVSQIVLADDSGIEIDYLNGAPGVLSARFLGEETPHSVKNLKILEMMKDVSFDKRTARFVCAIAAVFPDGGEVVKTATIEGYIGDAPCGAGGFGYDPIFFVPEYGKTTAELSPAQKNEISHRGKALRMIKEILLEREAQ